MRFRTLSPAERRAFIVASFFLGDEGKHWRASIKSEFSPFEELVADWAARKKNSIEGWIAPL